MNLGQQFRSKVITVEPAAPLREAVAKMQKENIGAIVAIRGKEVAGILTDRDIALALGSGKATTDTPVADVMTSKVITIWEDQGVFNATQYFLGHKVRRLPIVNRDNELVGMVTTDDVLALLGRELLNLAKAVEPALAMKE
jgi:CBS domain-containing protein